MEIASIVTHPGGAHKDDFLACALLLAEAPAPVERREPEEADLDDPAVAVVDVGGRHEPERNNFDHHQFPVDATPTCSLSLVLQNHGLYEDARRFFDWLEPAEWLDCRGPEKTCEHLGIDRDTLARLHSPLDATLIRRFAQAEQLGPGDTLWDVLRITGGDMLGHLRSMREHLRILAGIVQIWTLESSAGALSVAFLPRLDMLPREPTAGLRHCLIDKGCEASIAAVVYPDRRGEGYGLKRYRDHPAFDFTRLETASDVHFVHRTGFLAKTSAVEPVRLQALLQAARAHPDPAP